MAMSKVERVRSDCFSKIIAIVLCSSGCGRTFAFHAFFSHSELSSRPWNSGVVRSASDNRSRPRRLSTIGSSMVGLSVG
jgi:protein tyrosine phosphatase